MGQNAQRHDKTRYKWSDVTLRTREWSLIYKAGMVVAKETLYTDSKALHVATTYNTKQYNVPGSMTSRRPIDPGEGEDTMSIYIWKVKN